MDKDIEFTGTLKTPKVVETLTLDKGGLHEVTIDFNDAQDSLARVIRALIAEIHYLQVKFLK